MPPGDLSSSGQQWGHYGILRGLHVFLLDAIALTMDNLSMSHLSESHMKLVFLWDKWGEFPGIVPGHSR